MEVRKNVAPCIIVWMLCGFLVVLMPSSILVLNEEVDLLRKALPAADFYYYESGMFGSVVFLLLYEVVSLPILVYFVVKKIFKFGSAFSGHDCVVAFLFLFLCPMGVFMAEGLWADTGFKWGRMFLALIQSGPIGVLVYFYFWFGCFAYGVTVILVCIAAKWHEVNCK
ncbi:hypothetical protein [Marinobacter persicus]|nr:hypothetical protein [Marinobacter persicus]